jgi:hypothetical protein
MTAQLVACLPMVQVAHVQFSLHLFFIFRTISIMALETIIFVFFSQSLLYFSFLSNSRMRGVQLVSQHEKIENTPIFCNSEALHIVRIVRSTSDYCDRLVAVRMVLIANVMKEKFVAT